MSSCFNKKIVDIYFKKMNFPLAINDLITIFYFQTVDKKV